MCASIAAALRTAARGPSSCVARPPGEAASHPVRAPLRSALDRLLACCATAGISAANTSSGPPSRVRTGPADQVVQLRRPPRAAAFAEGSPAPRASDVPIRGYDGGDCGPRRARMRRRWRCRWRLLGRYGRTRPARGGYWRPRVRVDRPTTDAPRVGTRSAFQRVARLNDVIAAPVDEGTTARSTTRAVQSSSPAIPARCSSRTSH